MPPVTLEQPTSSSAVDARRPRQRSDAECSANRANTVAGNTAPEGLDHPRTNGSPEQIESADDGTKQQHQQRCSAQDVDAARLVFPSLTSTDHQGNAHKKQRNTNQRGRQLCVEPAEGADELDRQTRS